VTLSAAATAQWRRIFALLTAVLVVPAVMAGYGVAVGLRRDDSLVLAAAGIALAGCLVLLALTLRVRGLIGAAYRPGAARGVRGATAATTVLLVAAAAVVLVVALTDTGDSSPPAALAAAVPLLAGMVGLAIWQRLARLP
jgi:hypothetical protein